MRYHRGRVTWCGVVAGGAIVLSAAACHAATAGTAAPTVAVLPGGDAPSRHYERDRIGAAEVRSSGFATAYDVVAFRRPLFLRDRGPVSLATCVPTRPLVYANGLYLGGIEALRDLPARDVREIRFVDPWTADVRHHGRRHPSGAIEVVLGR